MPVWNPNAPRNTQQKIDSIKAHWQALILCWLMSDSTLRMHSEKWGPPPLLLKRNQAGHVDCSFDLLHEPQQRLTRRRVNVEMLKCMRIKISVRRPEQIKGQKRKPWKVSWDSSSCAHMCFHIAADWPVFPAVHTAGLFLKDFCLLFYTFCPWLISWCTLVELFAAAGFSCSLTLHLVLDDFEGQKRGEDDWNKTIKGLKMVPECGASVLLWK